MNTHLNPRLGWVLLAVLALVPAWDDLRSRAHPG